MPIQLSLNDLMDYTDWDRGKWHALLREPGAGALGIGVGPHGDGRVQNVGELIRHIFSAERRYVERLSGRAVSDTSGFAADDADALFRFGAETRAELRRFVDALPAERWDQPVEFTMMNSVLRVTPRKVVIHVLLHEIRHWAQVATMLRLQGVKGDFHDFLFSPALGGEIRR